MLGNIGPMEIVVVLIIALVVFGPKRLPELGNSLGRSIREFRSTISGEHGDDKSLGASRATAAEKRSETEVAQDKRG